MSEAVLEPFDDEDNDSYVDGMCFDCGAGPDEPCADDCPSREQEDEDDE